VSCHPCSPCNGRRVVTSDRHLGPQYVIPKSLLQNCFMEEHPRHLKARINDRPVGLGRGDKGNGDIPGPLYSPYNWRKVLFAPEPYSPYSKPTCVIVAHIVERALHQFSHMGGSASQTADKDGYVQQCLPHFAMPAQPDKGWKSSKALLMGVKKAFAAGRIQAACCRPVGGQRWNGIV
jgi:hypothetical protein